MCQYAERLIKYNKLFPGFGANRVALRFVALSVGVARLVQRLLRVLCGGIARVLSELRVTVGLCAHHQRVLARLEIRIVTLPCFEARLLQRTTVAKRRAPRQITQTVDGIQVHRRLLFRLPWSAS